MTVEIKFVVTVTDGEREWDCPVRDPKLQPITWGVVREAMARDPECPFKRGATIWIKSNWRRDDV